MITQSRTSLRSKPEQSRQLSLIASGRDHDLEVCARMHYNAFVGMCPTCRLAAAGDLIKPVRGLSAKHSLQAHIGVLRL